MTVDVSECAVRVDDQEADPRQAQKFCKRSVFPLVLLCYKCDSFCTV
jgi:hypothetical protein